MKILKISEFLRGWFIGNFEPSVHKTNQFEVGIMQHSKDEYWPKHYHKVATEYNLLIKGRLIIQNQTINEGDLFIIEPNEISDVVFLEDCSILCVKIPSVSNDKFIV